MIDIGSRNDRWYSKQLSNFAAHRFTVDDVQCNSMEGFLQSLKFQSPEIQVIICSLVGYEAKKAGKYQDWKSTQTLWWRGLVYSRSSQEYQDLLDKAYIKLSGSTSFKLALIATGMEELSHNIGRSNPKETVLTRYEFISRLYIIRDYYLANKIVTDLKPLNK